MIKQKYQGNMKGEKMGTIRDDVFLGTMEKYNQKLEMLAKMAQPEKWTYKKIQERDPYKKKLYSVHI